MEKTNSEAFTIQYNNEDFYITAQKPELGKLTTLHVCRQTGKIRQYPAGSSPLKWSDKTVKRLNFCLLIGIIIVRGQPFLALVTEAEPACEIVRDIVYCIRKVRFLPFRQPYNETTLGYADTVKLLDSIGQLIVQDNFYFSYGYPITLSQQRQSSNTGSKIDSQYFWNEHLLERFFGLGLEPYWHLPIMQGFIRTFSEENDYIQYHYIMISRRSKEMSGTRFNSRGLDTHGHAANFVETEEILVCHNFVLSYVQLRGSLPVFWVQPGFGAAIQFPQNRNNALVTPKHYRMLQENYSGHIVTVNLLGEEGSERQLSRKFQTVLAALPERSRDNYICFDLNREIEGRSDVQSVVNRFVERSEKTLLPQPNVYVRDYYRNKVLALQTSFNRCNCLDCLDRTNVIMFKVSERTMQYFEACVNSLVNNQEEKMIRLSKRFLELHRQVWLDHGDRISLIYSGTESVSSYITRGDKNKNFFSLVSSSFKSLNRFYNANVNDDFKQECLNYLLGVGDESRTFYFDDNIQRRLEPTRFNSFSELGLFLFSWNCNQVNPSAVDLSKLFDFPAEEVSIVVVCLQEIVELNTYNVLLGANKSTQQLWRERLEFHFREKLSRSYTYLVENDLVGILTMVFVCEPERPRITCLNWSNIKTGFKGNLGNKGAVLLSFYLDDAPITIINCHLEAGEGKVSERLYSLECIHQQAFPERFKRRQFQNSEFTFLVGDLNFRIDMSFEEAKEIFYELDKMSADQTFDKEDDPLYLQTIRKLQTKDELTICRNKKQHPILQNYNEKQITFLPTYKYVKGTNQYDFKSKRMPSWCDRILYSTEPLKLLPHYYDRKQTCESDHKPVAAWFDLMIRKEDKAKKRAEFERFMDQ